MAKFIGGNIDDGHSAAVFYLAGVQVMQMPVPMTILFEILGQMLRDQNMASTSTRLRGTGPGPERSGSAVRTMSMKST